MSYTYQYPHMAVTVDVVLFCTTTTPASVLLIKRANEPFKHQWALPGGYVDMGEKIEAAALRELSEETGARIDNLEFLGFFDAVDRDPRERTISLAFWAITTADQQLIKAADDACEAKWHSITQLPPLAFDHSEIIKFSISKLQPGE